MSRVLWAVVPFCCLSGVAAAAGCGSQALQSAAEVAGCIDANTIWSQLAHFQAIADGHRDARGHGNRDSGTAGYKASVDYVARLMAAAGYSVTVQAYPLKISALMARPAFAAAGRDFAYQADWYVARLSGSGAVSAPISAIAHGCDAGDFAGMARGNVALMPRGVCGADIQVGHAAAAGAGAVVLYSVPGGAGALPHGARRDGSAYEVRLTRPAGIPVIGAISFAAARQILAAQAPRARIEVSASVQTVTDYNVIADSPYGDSNHTVVIEGHLDSIYGAGMLDNASGSVSILDTALVMAKTPTKNHLRYIWFGGEELGLFGSAYYTTHLSGAEAKQIVFDLDADVTATPNFDVLIADPAYASNVKKFPPNVVPGSAVGNADFLNYFAAAGIAAAPASFGNDGTDSNSFSLIGVPNTGVLTNQDCCKGKGEVKIWGGFLGNYEGKIPGHNGGCVDNPGRWCDNLSNNDRFVFTFMSKGVGYVTYQLANDGRL